jgi:sugar phosphate isomerase/epimerase
MRFRHHDGTTVHLAYCTNVHPADTLADLLSTLDRYAVKVRAELGVPRLGVGLWLARDTVTEVLADPAGVKGLAAALAERGLEVVTLNAFPYTGFGDEVVKGRVYHPDWTTPERLAYTVDCARVLAGLLPPDVAYGSVSTLPLAWRDPWDAGRRAAAVVLTTELAEALGALGRDIRVGFEPEPGCIVETTTQAAHLVPHGPRTGVCLDACHLAVQFEDPAEAVARLTGAGLRVVKAQVSCALEAEGGEPALADFVEPRYLHQVRTAAGDGTDDLDEALAGGLAADGEWRVHFHVPLHAPPRPPLRSTSAALVRTLAVLLGGPYALTSHLEVETYTWSVLPPAARPGTDVELVAGIAAELAWTRDRLLELGLRAEEEVA